MKKFLLVSCLLFIIGVGCKKENVGGGGLCACSPILSPELNLVVKNGAGTDLLNQQNTGAFTTERISVYRKDATGKIIPISFAVRPPFSYGNETFGFHFLTVGNLDFLQKAPGEAIYLKLGDQEARELRVQFNTQRYAVDKLLIGGQEAPKDTGTVSKYTSIFYLTE
ncbi:hypothetical protein [Mucilaginibacter celer]|uniref:Lipoprotein n=1 Tax=Mucilaginibacter celer TaxID=2305508 RepID=A0A494VVD4_9SPHI|nr:hypothetical protein [Mucilaginibacter celer]AYL94952.1 hypothetical protein HYN43_006425 [Mucilaginibacter celer]